MDIRFQHNAGHRFVFVILLTIMSCVKIISGLSFDRQNTQILASANQYRIKLKPQGGIAPYSITYTRLPANWTFSEKYLFVPKSQSNIYNQDLISVVLKDAKAQEYRASLIFISNKEHIMMDTNSYPFDVQSDQIGLFSFNSNTNNNALSLKDMLQKKIQSILNQAQLQSTKSVGQNLDNVLTNLPDINTIKEAFNTNNIFVLVKTIGTVANSQLNCVQQVAYLSQMSALGYETLKTKQVDVQTYSKDLLSKLINAANNYSSLPQSNATSLKNSPQQGSVSISNSSLPKTDKNISTATPQNIYNKSISQLQDQVSTLKNQFYLLLDKLKVAYSRLSSLNSYFNTLNSKILITNIDIDKNKQQSNKLINNINGIKTKSLAINLTDAQKRVFVSQIQTYNNSINQLNTAIQTLKQSLTLQQKSLTDISALLDSQKLQTLNLQTNISSIQYKISSINRQLLSLYQQLSPPSTVDSTALFFVLQANPQLLYMNLRVASQLGQYQDNLLSIYDLQRIMEFVTFNLDDLYRTCYGLPKSNVTYYTNSNYTTSAGINQGVYMIPYSSFVNYFQKIYADSSSSSNGLIIGNNSVDSKYVQLSTVNVLSSIWTKRFGDALPLITSSGGNVNPTNCYSMDGLQSNSGIIIQITKNIVQVGLDNGQILYVLFGACTRIQMSNTLIPEKGNMMFWRGRRIQNFGNLKDVFDSYYVLIL